MTTETNKVTRKENKSFRGKQDMTLTLSLIQENLTEEVVPKVIATTKLRLKLRPDYRVPERLYNEQDFINLLNHVQNHGTKEITDPEHPLSKFMYTVHLTQEVEEYHHFIRVELSKDDTLTLNHMKDYYNKAIQETITNKISQEINEILDKYPITQRTKEELISLITSHPTKENQ